MVKSRPVRAYTYELCDSIIPRDVLDTLGEPDWIRQARVLVFEETATRAHTALLKIGGRWSIALPRVAHGNNVDALTFAEYNNPGAVFVISQTGKVAEVFPTESRLIGEIEPGEVVLRRVSHGD